MGTHLRDAIQLARPQKYGTFVSVVIGFAVGTEIAQNSLHLGRLGLLFVSFAVLLYTGIYMLNDLLDKPFDVLHRSKRSRPVASGRIPPSRVLLIGSLLVSFGMITAMWLSATVVLLEGGFVLLNFLYSRWLKHVPFLDIVANTVTHPMRVLLGMVAAGGVASSGIPVIIASAMVYWSSNSLKRHFELDQGYARSRPVLRYYSGHLLMVLAVLPGIPLVCLEFVHQSLLSRAFCAFALMVWGLTVGIYLWGSGSLRRSIIRSLTG